MSKTLDKTELVRVAWLTELRRQGHRKCEDSYRKGGMVCALGLLAEVADFDLLGSPCGSASMVGETAGLTSDQSFEVAARNDGSEFIDDENDPVLGLFHVHTFAEIADIVEGWFKT